MTQERSYHFAEKHFNHVQAGAMLGGKNKLVATWFRQQVSVGLFRNMGIIAIQDQTVLRPLAARYLIALIGMDARLRRG